MTLKTHTKKYTHLQKFLKCDQSCRTFSCSNTWWTWQRKCGLQQFDSSGSEYSNVAKFTRYAHPISAPFKKKKKERKGKLTGRNCYISFMPVLAFLINFAHSVTASLWHLNCNVKFTYTIQKGWNFKCTNEVKMQQERLKGHEYERLCKS